MHLSLKLIFLTVLTVIHAPCPACSFIPIPLVDKGCKATWNIIKICPRYCASKHPGRFLWGLACICCKMPGEDKPTDTPLKPSKPMPASGGPSTNKITTTTTLSPDISDLEKLKLLLKDLKKQNLIPPVEADNWIARLDTVGETLLTVDEQVLLTNLLIQAGVSWKIVFTLLHPISEKIPPSPKPKPKPSTPSSAKPSSSSSMKPFSSSSVKPSSSSSIKPSSSSSLKPSSSSSMKPSSSSSMKPSSSSSMKPSSSSSMKPSSSSSMKPSSSSSMKPSSSSSMNPSSSSSMKPSSSSSMNPSSSSSMKPSSSSMTP